MWTIILKINNACLNHCDLCNEIRGSLVRSDSGRFRELAPEGHNID